MSKLTITIETDNVPGLMNEIVPNFNPPKYPGNIPNMWDIRQQPNPCENCPNNPLNNPFATGFCNCILGSLNNIIY